MQFRHSRVIEVLGGTDDKDTGLSLVSLSAGKAFWTGLGTVVILVPLFETLLTSVVERGKYRKTNHRLSTTCAMPTVETNGVQTYYEEYGEGPPVVFLHGARGAHRLWAEQVQSLAKDHRLIVYDLRGHGRTGGSEVDSYTIRLYVDDLNALITSLDLNKPAICGRSMGGMVALAYTATYPATIGALCTLGAETPEAQTRGEWFERRILPKLINALSVVINRDRLMAVMHRIDEWRYDPRGAGDMEAIERILQRHAEDFPESSEEESTKIREALESYSSTSIDYSSIAVPSLILYGEYEIALISRHAKYMKDVIPHAEIGQIPNACHVSTVDNLDFVVTSLREFLDS